jgi:hypothetical protein
MFQGINNTLTRKEGLPSRSPEALGARLAGEVVGKQSRAHTAFTPGWEASKSRIGRGKHTKLHHQAECIHDDASALDFAALETVDDHAPNLHGPTGGRHAKKLTSVCASPLEAGHYFVGFSDLLLDRPVHVRKRGPHAAQDILQSFQAWTLAGKWNLLHHVLRKELPGGVEVPLVQNFLNEVSDDAVIILHKVVMLLPSEDHEPLREATLPPRRG